MYAANLEFAAYIFFWLFCSSERSCKRICRSVGLSAFGYGRYIYKCNFAVSYLGAEIAEVCTFVICQDISRSAVSRTVCYI